MRMTNTVSVMMSLIADTVLGTAGRPESQTAKAALTDEELQKLDRLSDAHDLSHLVGSALLSQELIRDEEWKARFKKQIMKAVFRCEKNEFELERLKETLSRAQIPFIPLKGSVLRAYYPEPWMRTSCDIDILVHEEDLERAGAVLCEKLSYQGGEKNYHDVAFYAPGGVHLELHYTLCESKAEKDFDPVLESAWERAFPACEGSFEQILPDELFYYYHLAHMAKHFEIGGCGVRPFLDLFVLCHKVPHDKEKRNALLEEGGLSAFAGASEQLSKVWFGGAGHTALTRQMEAYLLGGGVYGTTSNRVSVQQVKRGGKIRYALSRIWLPYDSLKFHYPSLEGKRFLLPFYEIRRWCKLIFRGGARRGINEMHLNATATKEAQSRTAQMLSELELNR